MLQLVNERDSAHSPAAAYAPRRLRALAAFIEQRTDKPLVMHDCTMCAYAFAQALFGDNETLSAVNFLKDELSISRDDANAIWRNTDASRADVVLQLRGMAERYEVDASEVTYVTVG